MFRNHLVLNADATYLALIQRRSEAWNEWDR